MKNIILLALLTWVSSMGTIAQSINGKINIKITEKDGKPLPFTSVVLRLVKDSTLVKGELSSTNGACTFEKINEGKYFIQASLLGYGTAATPAFSIDANHRSVQLPALVLLPAAKDLQGVTVSAQKPFIERKAGATILNVESSVAAAGSNALDILKRAPGVQVDKDDNVLLKGNQGVTVMLDGKLTYLSGEQLSNLLKSMPAKTIAQIEIITSPSAKYDAAGNSGIINIKTKKGVITGINGSVNASIGAGRYPLYNAGLNLNWRTEKFNLFGNYNYANRNFFNDRDLIRNIPGDVTQRFAQEVFGTRKFESNNFKVGMDYFITPKHTVGVLMNGYQNGFFSDTWSHTSISGPSKQIDSILHSFSNTNNHFDNTTVNVNYKGELDTLGTEISMDADLAQFNYKRRVLMNDSLQYTHTPGNTGPNAIRNNTRTEITIKSIKADLVLPFNKTSKLEAGVKGSFVTTDNTLLYDSLIQDKYQPALTQSNQFFYKENVLAAYAIYKKQFAHTEISAGVRMEQTTSDGNSVTLQTRIKRNYLDFFPSLSVDHTFSETHKLSLSYAKRINRPGYDDLNPFIFFLDKYTYGKGNPFLNPEYTHVTELSYTLKQKYIVSVGYNITNNIILEYLDQNDSTKVTTSTEKNFERRNSYNMTLTVPIDPFPWWNITNNLNLNYNSFQVKDTTLNLAFSQLAANYQTTHTFTLPANWKVELNAYYNSPFVWGIFKGRSSYAIGLGVQKSILNKRATLKLNVTDIFKGEQFRGVAQYNTVDMYIHNRWQNRTINFAVTYNFGNSAVKAARERETGTSEEQKRTGN